MTFRNNVFIIIQKGTHQHRGKGEIEKGGGGRREKVCSLVSELWRSYIKADWKAL